MSRERQWLHRKVSSLSVRGMSDVNVTSAHPFEEVGYEVFKIEDFRYRLQSILSELAPNIKSKRVAHIIRATGNGDTDQHLHRKILGPFNFIPTTENL